MFSIKPFTAQHLVANKKPDGGMSLTWQQCRVIGVDASGDEPTYVIEIRATDGSFCLDRTDQIRKPEPK